jgi:AcrR family transcriptional regulator
MKTREKILLASLALFNDEGEPNVTTVDIAAELDISPGNLYYHFKGKSVIILELYDRFEAELIDILNAPLATLNDDDSWIYLYVIFEHIYAFRFFYQHQRDIIQRVPKLEGRYKRLLRRKYNNAMGLLNYFRDNEIIAMSDDEVAEISDNIVLVQTAWLNYEDLRDLKLSDELMLHRGVFQIIVMIAPYLTEAHKDKYQHFRALYHSRLLAEA